MARPAIVNDLKNLHLSRACLFLLHFRALDICSQFLGVPDIWLEIIFKIFFGYSVCCFENLQNRER